MILSYQEILIVIGTLAIIFFSGEVAKSKGMNYLTGLIIGLLLNFIGLIVLILLPDKNQDAEK